VIHAANKAARNRSTLLAEIRKWPGLLLRVLGESFAASAVKNLNRGDREEKPRRSRSESTTSAVLCIAECSYPRSLFPGSLFAKMPSRQIDEHILQACLPRGQMLQLAVLLVDGFEQRRNRQMRLLYVQCDQAIILAHRFDAGQSAPCCQSCSRVITADRK